MLTRDDPPSPPLQIQADLAKRFNHVALIMDRTVSGCNKPYSLYEEEVLVCLKKQHLTWSQLAYEFNRRVDGDRQRTLAGLENKWQDLKAMLPGNSKVLTIRPRCPAFPKLTVCPHSSFPVVIIANPWTDHANPVRRQ